MRVALHVTNTSPPKDRKQKAYSSLGFFNQNKITTSLSGSFQHLPKHRVDSKIGICENTSSSCSPKIQQDQKRKVKTSITGVNPSSKISATLLKNPWLYSRNSLKSSENP
jgi:hypothetical protein